jgi:hypothetical protein
MDLLGVPQAGRGEARDIDILELVSIMGVKMRQSPLRSEATPVTDKDAEVASPALVADSRVNCANVIE